MVFGGGDGGGKETLRGAVIVLVVGLVLGVSYNALARMGRPPRGLPWVSGGPPPMPTLESLQPPGSADTTAASSAVARPTEQPLRDRAPETTPTDTRRPVPVVKAQQPTPAPSAPTPAPSQPASSAADLPVVPDVPGPVQLELPSFKKLYDANAALVVDAREADAYQEGHIAGAVSLPYNDALAEPERAKNLDSGGRPIVIYCSGITCEVSLDLAGVLVKAGKRRVLVFKGGYPAWQTAGYPTRTGTTP